MEYWSFFGDYSFLDNLLLRDEIPWDKAAAFAVSVTLLFRVTVISIKLVRPHGDRMRRAVYHYGEIIKIYCNRSLLAV